MIRKVQINDAGVIANIYNHYISETTATLELVEIDAHEIEKRILKVTQKEDLPYLVYLKDHKIVGYAYATIWRQREGYKFSIESSVYVKENIENKGIGTKLYTKLISELKDLNYSNIIGVLTLPNEASVKFHEKFGFKQVGHFDKVGFKFDKWHDVGFWQLKL